MKSEFKPTNCNSIHMHLRNNSMYMDEKSPPAGEICSVIQRHDYP